MRLQHSLCDIVGSAQFGMDGRVTMRITGLHQSGGARRRTRRVRWLGLLLGVLLLTSCAANGTSDSNTSTPPAGLPTADPLVRQLSRGINDGDLSKLPTLGSAGDAEADRLDVMFGMDSLTPTVTPEPISYRRGEGSATVALHQSFSLGTATWRFDSTAQLVWLGEEWRVEWAPTILHPSLTERTRLRHTRTVGKRASITGNKGLALVEERPVIEIGLDKTLLPPEQWVEAGTAIAVRCGVDESEFVDRVQRTGDEAFVSAITVRTSDVPAGVAKLPGSRLLDRTAMLAPSKTFASAILGSMGPASPETISASNGDLQPGDQVGVTGLQARYDEQLRGKPGHAVELVNRPGMQPSAEPNDQGAPDATPSTSPSSTNSAAGTVMVETLYSTEASPGTPVQTTLDLDAQFRAEEVLSGIKSVAALVSIEHSTGAIRAAATSPASRANPDATFGRYPPGSTFKVATALALLRSGLTPGSIVECPASTTVNGRVFNNYSDYPSSLVGRITLTQALAHSCNTAFIGQADRLSLEDLSDAAASLGVGVDHDAGFASFYGSVPPPRDQVTKAADMIGQGQVLASPMAMAGLSASVAEGRTVIPYLVADIVPEPDAPALTATEASQLQQMMSATVASGTARTLSGLMTGAKTGTAEYGTSTPPRTHAWMISWRADLAIAVMVYDGSSGSTTAAPLIKEFLK